MDKRDQEQFILRQIMKEPSQYVQRFGITGEKEKLFNRLSFYNGNIPASIENILQHVREQCLDVVSSLTPLYQLGFRFDIDVAGGAVRDILLGTPEFIKDLDILISVTPKTLDDVFKTTPIATIQAVLDIHDTDIFEHDSSLKSFFYLIAHCMKKSFPLFKSIHVDSLFSKAEDYRHVFEQTDLEGVLKFDGENGFYPMDVLVIPKDTITYINEHFNFSICKAWINLLDKNNPTQRVYNHFTFLNNFFVANDFMDDVMRKTITLDMPRLRHEEVIERSLKEHLPRIMAKHQGYELVLRTGGETKWEKWKTSYENYMALQHAVPEKTEPVANRLKI